MSHAKSFWTRMKNLPDSIASRRYFTRKAHRSISTTNSAKTAQRGIAQCETIFLTILPRKIGSKELSEPSFYIARGGDELTLEIHLDESSVAGAPQTVASH
jgi:hypothetical protein